MHSFEFQSDLLRFVEVSFFGGWLCSFRKKISYVKTMLEYLFDIEEFKKMWKCSNYKHTQLKWLFYINTAQYRSRNFLQQCEVAKMRAHGTQWISRKMYNRHPLQLKKSKSWEPFGSYQLNSTADLANLAQVWGKWAGLAVLFSW